MSIGEERRQRRAARRRRAILEAAARVFGQRGFGRATTKEIASEADVSEGTLYNYFGSKEEMLMSIIQDVVPGLFSEELLLPEGETLRDRFVAGLERVLAFAVKNREMLTVLVAEMWHNQEIKQEWVDVYGQELLERIQAKLERLKALGLLRPVDTAVGARIILSTTLGMAMPILMGAQGLELMGDGPDASERLHYMAESSAKVLMHGLLLTPDRDLGGEHD